MSRRLFAFLLAVCMAFGLLPVTGYASDGKTVNVIFSVFNGSWDDGSTELTVPFGYGHVLTQDDLPEDMIPRPNFGGGFWLTDPVGTEITEEITFRYMFQPLVYVTFDASGGAFPDGETEQDLELISGQACGELPEAPVRDGYFFMGWNTSPDGFGSRFTAGSAAEEDLIVYAVWTEIVSVTFDGNHGNWTVEEKNENGESVPVYLDEWEIRLPAGEPWEAHLPEEPDRPGFAFDGWSLEPDGEALEGDADFQEGTRVFALWKKVFILGFEGNGDAVENIPGPQSSTEGGFAIPDTEPNREGHTFLGWNTRADGKGDPVEPGGVYSPEESESLLYALWERQICTVVFDELTEVECLWGDTLGSLPEPEDPGPKYRFGGWYAEDAPFAPDTPVREDLTLYPHWIPQAEVTFRIENGTWTDHGGTSCTITVDEGNSIVDMIPKFEPNEGFKASGSWDTQPETASDGDVYTYICDPLDKFTVTLMVDGEEYGILEATEGRPLGSLPTPEREGRVFLGWFRDADGDNLFESDAVIEENITLFAGWHRIFTLFYDGGGENVSSIPESQTAEGPGDSFTFPISDQKPQRPGYTFLGWADGDGDPVEGSITVTGEATLYARWEKEPMTFLLHYDGNGGTDAPESQILESLLTQCAFTVSTEAPVRPGYLFLGWSLSPEAETAEFHRGDLCTVTDELTLYAVWEEAADPAFITFLDGEVEVCTLPLEPGAPLTLPEEPSRPGHIFLGWNTRPDGSGAAVDEDTVLSTDLTVYALWHRIETFPLTFLDRDMQILQLSLTEGELLGDRLPDAPSRDGFLFRGWNTRSDGSGEAIDNTTVINAETTAHAVWERDTQAEVSFMNEGREIACVTLEIGAQLGTNLPQEPVREGFRFLGWNTREDGTGKRIYKSTYIREDTVLYAQWEEIIYVTVTFLDRECEVLTVTLEAGQRIGDAMPDNPVRSGYSFKGWYTEQPSGGKKLYKTTAIKEDLVVYARWSAKKTSNPKTGDAVTTWVAALLFSGTGLGILFGKKRR